MTRLKKRGVRQEHIAGRARVSQATVSKVLARLIRNTPNAERVWQEVEAALVERVS